MSVRLPDVFIDAKTIIEDTLNSSMKVSIRRYGSLYSNLSDVLHFHVEEVEDIESYANLDMIITYKSRVLSKVDRFELVEKTRKLRVLNSTSDCLWTYRMVHKIWGGDYPSTVAVDMETGEVFLFSLRVNSIELCEFGVLGEKEFETFKLELNDREPYKIKLDARAMFDFIDGGEGINHLSKNVYIEFNCGIPLKVYSKMVGVI